MLAERAVLSLGSSLPLKPHLAAVALVRALGGVGSGNFGHEGRPGEVGGSGEGGANSQQDKALREYTTENAQDLNYLLRSQSKTLDPGMGPQIRSLDSLMASVSVKTTLYRISNHSELARLQVGGKFVDHGFASTTMDKSQLGKIAKDVGLKGSYVTLIINAPKGTKMIDINRHMGAKHQYAHQKEHLLARGTRFTVTRKVGNTLYVEASQ